eukprot:CAMPEP_0197238274 /NCGR_PEP_ID=MMETSP1429-20130617/4798_1 /TAXON_ID=49237 /ORGANISM="Chaetoceros  sp., Strain UNC1202" /LENGTH=249 /DNA_ID=CAMNT_0042697391 /DNA_START=64 /DNA_END=813 /DNA_ORIENTATION=-
MSTVTKTDAKKRKVENGTTSSSTVGPSKKKKNGKVNGKAKSNSASSSDTKSDDGSLSSFKPFTLAEVRTKIAHLSTRLPTIPDDGIDPDDKEAVIKWTGEVQAIIEEFNLLLCCVSAATYRWGSDRSGAADQNLSLLNSELANAQDQISASVTPRLSHVLAPVVDLVIEETVTTTTKDEKTEGKRSVNHYKTVENDPSFIRLCRGILCRNAVMLRQLLMTNFHKVGRCIDDYLKATKKDGDNNRNGFSF